MTPAFEIEKKYLEAELRRLTNDIGEATALRNAVDSRVRALVQTKSDTQDKLMALMQGVINASGQQ